MADPVVTAFQIRKGAVVEGTGTRTEVDGAPAMAVVVVEDDPGGPMPIPWLDLVERCTTLGRDLVDV